MLGLRAAGNEVRAQEIYFTRDMKNHHGGVVLVNGYLYGYNDSILTCLEFASGKMMWRDRSVGKGAVTLRRRPPLYPRARTTSSVSSRRRRPDIAKRAGSASPIRGWPSWAHPVVSGGRLYIRNQGTLTSYDVRAR